MRGYCQLTGCKKHNLFLKINICIFRDKFFINKEAGNDCKKHELEKAAKFRAKYGSMIVSKFRKTNISLLNKEIPTFPEFIKYLIRTRVDNYNPHWMPVSYLCKPCHVNYNIIAKY